MKTKVQAKELLNKISRSELSGLNVNLHELEKAEIPKWKRMLHKYIMKGVVPEGGHNPVRLWIVGAPFSPLNVFEK